MLTIQKYSITDIQDEVRALIARGSVGRQQRIYELRRNFGDHQWQDVERLLEANDYSLKDHVIELTGKESWMND